MLERNTYTDFGQRSISIEKLEWFFLFFGSVLILFGTANKLFTFVAFALYAVLIFWGDDEFAVNCIVYVMPFAVLFKARPNTISFYTFLMLLYAAKEMISTSRLPSSVLPFMIFVMMGQCVAGRIDTQRTLKLFSNLLFLNYAIITRDRYSAKRLFIVYVIAIILSSLFRFLDSSTFRIARYMDELDMVGDKSRFCGLNNDANMYVINVIISLCLIVFMYDKKQLSAVISLILAAPLVYFAIITYSKSALLMLCLPFVALLYSNQKQRRIILQSLLIIASLAVLFAVLAGKVEAVNVTMQRFSNSEGDLDKLTTGRTRLWRWYIDYYITHPRILILGGGLGAKLINSHGVHNVYLQIPYYIGLIGEIWLFLILHKLMVFREQQKKRGFLNYTALFSIFIMYFFLSELFDYQAPIHLLLASLMLNDCNHREETDEFAQDSRNYQPS